MLGHFIGARTKTFLLAGILVVATAFPAWCDEKAEGAKAVDLSGVVLRVGQTAKGRKPVWAFAPKEITTTPYRVEWADFDAGPPLLTALVSGSLDVGTVGWGGAIAVQSGGTTFKAIATGGQPVREFQLILPQGSPITVVKDLAGKRIGVMRGSAGHDFLIAALEHAKLGVNDVALVNITPAAGLAAFARGDLDAWAIWEPYSAQVKAKLGARLLEDGTGYWQPGGWTVTTEVAIKDPKKASAISDFVVRFAKASDYARADADGWATAYAKETGVPLEFIKDASFGKIMEVQPITPEYVKAYLAEVELLYRGGLIRTKPIHPESIVDTTFVRWDRTTAQR